PLFLFGQASVTSAPTGGDQQKLWDDHDRQMMAGLKVIKPQITWLDAPLKPLQTPDADQSVLFGRSPHMVSKDFRPAQEYAPMEAGAFKTTGTPRSFCRHINHGQNRLITGDVPIFRVNTATGNGCYLKDNRTFPLWNRPDASQGNVLPIMGT